MEKIKLFTLDIVKRIATRMGYAIFSISDLIEREKKLRVGDSGLKIVEGVKVLSMKVWTEGEKPCTKHVYLKARVPNSHKSAAKENHGKCEHTDYICTECTHRMCVTEWPNV